MSNTPAAQQPVRPLTKALSLIFIGGIADSGKSVLIDQISAHANDVKSFAVSDFLKDTLSTKRNYTKEKLGPEVTLIDWKSHEPDAIKELCAKIEECFNDVSKNTVIVNTHFATYSPGGFMIGLDPNSIDLICHACKLTDPGATSKAVVVLVDIGIADVLHRREKRWTASVDTFTIGSALAQDLESNRLYALQYYMLLTATLGRLRVLYHRLSVDYNSETHLHEELEKVPEFKLALNTFSEFLAYHGFIREKHTWR